MSALARAQAREQTSQTYRVALRAYYREHAPHMMHKVVPLLRTHAGREDELLRKIGDKYGVPVVVPAQGAPRVPAGPAHSATPGPGPGPGPGPVQLRALSNEGLMLLQTSLSPSPDKTSNPRPSRSRNPRPSRPRNPRPSRPRSSMSTAQPRRGGQANHAPLHVRKTPTAATRRNNTASLKKRVAGSTAARSNAGAKEICLTFTLPRGKSGFQDLVGDNLHRKFPVTTTVADLFRFVKTTKHFRRSGFRHAQLFDEDGSDGVVALAPYSSRDYRSLAQEPRLYDGARIVVGYSNEPPAHVVIGSPPKNT